LIINRLFRIFTLKKTFMQDRAIAAIGEWQLEMKKDLEEVNLYVENMYLWNFINL